MYKGVVSTCKRIHVIALCWLIFLFFSHTSSFSKTAWPDIPSASKPMDQPKMTNGHYGIELDNIILPETIAIPAGSFNMGQPDINLGCYHCAQDEQPVHMVEISAFEMGRFEVTNIQYLPFSIATGRENAEWRQFFTAGKEDHPVVNVSWTDAQAYCAWLQAYTDQPYRLPTEAEWEYAARANTSRRYIFSNELNKREANFNKDRKGPVKVGSFPANRFGLHEVLGNVWEWCADWYQDGYYKQSPQKDPPGPSQGQYRVLRGGSWLSNHNESRIANRTWYNPGYILDGRGFRIALTRKEEKNK